MHYTKGAVGHNYDLGGQFIHEIYREENPFIISLERGG
jgi:hypothetical protein